MKQILMAVLIVTAATSCTSKQEEKSNSDNAQKEQKTELLKVADVMNHPADYTDQEIIVEGMVTHVCRHGGKKLHLSDAGSDLKLRIKAGENMNAFERELEGSSVQVSGKFIEERIDQAYIEKLKKGDVEEHHDHADGEDHTGDHEQKVEESGQGVSDEYIQELKQKIEESEQGYISEYWLVARKVTNK